MQCYISLHSMLTKEIIPFLFNIIIFQNLRNRFFCFLLISIESRNAIIMHHQVNETLLRTKLDIFKKLQNKKPQKKFSKKKLNNL